MRLYAAVREFFARTLEDDRGSLLFVGLPLVFAGAGLAWYFVGTVETILYRENLQVAADRVAFSSAVWHARGMNIIALINLVMSGLLAIILTLKLFEIVFGVLIGICTGLLAIPSLQSAAGNCVRVAGRAESAIVRITDRLQPKLEQMQKGLSQVERTLVSVTPVVAFVASMAEEEGGKRVKGGKGAITLSISYVPDVLAKQRLEHEWSMMTIPPRMNHSSALPALPLEAGDPAALCGAAAAFPFRVATDILRSSGQVEAASVLNIFSWAIGGLVETLLPGLCNSGGGRNGVAKQKYLTAAEQGAIAAAQRTCAQKSGFDPIPLNNNPGSGGSSSTGGGSSSGGSSSTGGGSSSGGSSSTGGTSSMSTGGTTTTLLLDEGASDDMRFKDDESDVRDEQWAQNDSSFVDEEALPTQIAARTRPAGSGSSSSASGGSSSASGGTSFGSTGSNSKMKWSDLPPNSSPTADEKKKYQKCMSSEQRKWMHQKRKLASHSGVVQPPAPHATLWWPASGQLPPLRIFNKGPLALLQKWNFFPNALFFQVYGYAWGEPRFAKYGESKSGTWSMFGAKGESTTSPVSVPGDPNADQAPVPSADEDEGSADKTIEQIRDEAKGELKASQDKLAQCEAGTLSPPQDCRFIKQDIELYEQLVDYTEHRSTMPLKKGRWSDAEYYYQCSLKGWAQCGVDAVWTPRWSARLRFRREADITGVGSGNPGLGEIFKDTGNLTPQERMDAIAGFVIGLFPIPR